MLKAVMEKASCLCGDVTITVSGTPINSRYCHCRQCQKAIGAPSFARVLFNQKDVNIEGPVKSYSSSPELDRLFCGQCGASVAAKRKNGSVIGIATALFDNSDTFAPTEHVWVSEKQVWDDLNNKLTKFSQNSVLKK